MKQKQNSPHNKIDFYCQVCGVKIKRTEGDYSLCNKHRPRCERCKKNFPMRNNKGSGLSIYCARCYNWRRKENIRILGGKMPSNAAGQKGRKKYDKYK